VRKGTKKSTRRSPENRSRRPRGHVRPRARAFPARGCIIARQQFLAVVISDAQPVTSFTEFPLDWELGLLKYQSHQDRFQSAASSRVRAARIDRSLKPARVSSCRAPRESSMRNRVFVGDELIGTRTLGDTLGGSQRMQPSETPLPAIASERAAQLATHRVSLNSRVGRHRSFHSPRSSRGMIGTRFAHLGSRKLCGLYRELARGRAFDIARDQRRATEISIVDRFEKDSR